MISPKVGCKEKLADTTRIIWMYDCMWMILDLRNGKTMAVPLNQPENLLAISHISIISNPTLRLKMETIDSDSDMYIHTYIYI